MLGAVRRCASRRTPKLPASIFSRSLPVPFLETFPREPGSRFNERSNMIVLLSLLGLFLLLMLIPFGLACFAFWVWMLVHSIRNDNLTGTSRVLWAALVWFLPFIGSVIYFILGRTAAPRRLMAA